MMIFKRMNSVYRQALVLLVSGLSLTFAAGPVAAHPHEWDVKMMLGVAVPTGDLSNAVNSGIYFGVTSTRWLNTRMGVHFGFAADRLGGKTVSGLGDLPDLALMHYNGGLEFDLINPATSKARLHANAGLGGTTTSVKDGGSSSDFTLNGGLNLEYMFGEKVNGLVGIQPYVILASTTEILIPIYVGFRYFFE